MPHSRLSPKRLAFASLIVTIPAASSLVVLMAAGQLTFWGVAAGAGFAWLLSLLLVRPFYLDFANLAAWLRLLAEDSKAAPPDLRTSGPADELLGAIGLQRRAQAQQTEAMRGLMQSSDIVLDGLPDPFFMLDEDHRILRANQAARSLFGRELAGRDMASIMRDPRFLDALEKVAAGQSGRQVELTLALPVERYFSARLEPLPVRTSEGAVAVVSLHDVTALRRIEQMRADFVANASHELRTPLASLLGFTETLRGPAKDDPEAQERFLGIMAEQGARMARLIDDLLSLSRIEMNEHSFPQDIIDVAPVLRNVADTLQPIAKRRGVSVTVEIPGDLPPVLGQADELAQVFQNLIDNAIKYGRDSAPVEIRAERRERGPALPGRKAGLPVLAISVRDHGEGIPAEHIPRLTERFFRVDTARSRKMGGTGLGLAIVKHVLNRHRGVLIIESRLGEGSVFSVCLPPAEKSH